MLTTIAIAFCAVTLFAQATTISIVIVRLRRRTKEPEFGGEPPFVTIIRPIRGVENHLDLCFESSFKLSYPNYEVIFC
ncbi:MAG: ceramide glucosyltransferase, partial [Alphaproteobacteria bacterium]